MHSATQRALAIAAREAKWAKIPEDAKLAPTPAFTEPLNQDCNVLDANTIAATKRSSKSRDEHSHSKCHGWSLEVDYARIACLGSLSVIDQMLMQNERKVLDSPAKTEEQRVSRNRRALRKEPKTG